MPDLEQRVRLLEEQVEILSRALVVMTASVQPGREWMDTSLDEARAGKFRYTTDQEN